mgnify:CR=1 FL=1
MIINQQEFKLHDKLIDRISIDKFVISHKLNFSTPISDIFQYYWKYAKDYNLVGQSLSKNIESYINLRPFRDFNAYCYNIKDVNINDVNEAVTIAFNDYKSQNKYSSLKGFKENDRNYRRLLLAIKNLKEYSNFKQIDDDNGLKIYIVNLNSKKPRMLDSPINTFYSSTLSLIEISEYVNIIYNELINFEPDKNTDKETIKQPDQESIKQRFDDIQNDYYVFVELLATGKLEEFGGNKFKFNDREYNDATELNKDINSHFKFEKTKNLYPYIRQLITNGNNDIFNGTSIKFKRMKNHLISRDIRVEDIKHTQLKEKLSNIETK